MLIKVNGQNSTRAKDYFCFSMSKRGSPIPVLLMILAIIAIITFQSYWLYKNYQEEKQTLRIQTNILFREAVYECQVRNIKLDSNTRLRHAAPANARVISTLQNRLRDTLRSNEYFKSKILITSDKQFRPGFRDSIHLEVDSGKVRKFISSTAGGTRNFIEVLEDAGALQDSVTLEELYKQYRSMLAKEKISLPFTITRHAGVGRKDFFPPDFEEANQVTLGFLNPVTFKLSIRDATPYILRKLSPIILVSVFLVGLTILSFVLLYRNLMRQRKLTALKNDFIGNITHELKTPIATVSVAIEAMKNFNALSDPKKTQEYLNISANELQRLSLLVDKVLRLSMFEKKEIEFKKESFDIGQLTLGVMDSMKIQFEKQQAETSLKLSGKNFSIEADKRHIASVIYNLLDNALKYSADIPVISVHIIDQTSYLELRVTDKGIGISKEYRQKIFEQFFRVPSGDRHNTKGYGLGLSYVNHIVRSHMGFIEVDTELGKGSTFIVKLPFSEAPVIHYDGKRTVRKITFKI